MWRLWASLAGLAAVLGSLSYIHVKSYQAGRAAERQAILTRINKENENAGNSAENWRAQYRSCVDAGGLFDFEAGSCDH